MPVNDAVEYSCNCFNYQIIELKCNLISEHSPLKTVLLVLKYRLYFMFLLPISATDAEQFSWLLNFGAHKTVYNQCYVTFFF